MKRMKALPVIAAIVGLAVMGILVVHFGAGGVRPLLAIGWSGFSAMCVIHLAPIAVMGVAWPVTVPGALRWVFL